MSLTRDRVLELFDVDLASGAVLWKKPTSFRVRAGEPAAAIVGIDGVRYSLDYIRHLVRCGSAPIVGALAADPAEGWRVIAGFSGGYEVSDQGVIRSRERWVACKGGALRLFPAVTLKPRPQRKTGYLAIILRDANTGQMREATVHALVAEAFLPPRPEGHEVRHKDGTRTNNRADNLEWGDHVDNMRDQYRHGTRIASTWHHKAKLTAEQIAEIRESNKSGAEIARELGLSVSTVCRARNGKTYAVLSRADLPALLTA